MTGLGLGLDSRLGLDFRLRGNDEVVIDSRLRGNDEMVVDSRLCGGGNDGSGSCGGGCFLAIGCKKGGAENQAQEGYCRLPIADCRLPIADCRLPILRQRRLRSSWSGWFVSCLFLLYYANDLCHRQKPLYPQKIHFRHFPVPAGRE